MQNKPKVSLNISSASSSSEHPSQASSKKPQKIKAPYVLTYDEEEQLKEAFAVFDQSGDGLIDAEELKTILEEIMKREFDDEEIMQMIEQVDDSGDGEVDVDEFLMLINEQMQTEEPEEELIETFKSFGAMSVDDKVTFEMF